MLINSVKKSIALPASVWNDLKELTEGKRNTSEQLRICLDEGIRAIKKRRAEDRRLEMQNDSATDLIAKALVAANGSQCETASEYLELLQSQLSAG